MLEPALVLFRLAQYAGAAILTGSSLFLVYALAPAAAASLAWPRRLLAAAAAVLAAAALLGLGVQTGVMAGSLAEGLKPDALVAVATGTGLGLAALVRAAAAALALVIVLAAPPGRPAWLAAGGLGLTGAASLAWMGHGAATEGAAGLVHLIADIAHSWAAALWLGALAAFLALLAARDPAPAATAALHRALGGFSALGLALVATLIVTGLVNSGFLVGPERLASLVTTPYGRLLSLKLAAFAGMLALAAANRGRLTPALGRALAASDGLAAALSTLKRSIAAEAALGAAVLALVAWLGTLPPPAAG